MRQHQPPNWIRRILEAICDPVILEGALGDLEELFEDRLKEKGPRSARWGYVLGALGFLRPFAWKKKNEYTINHLDMLKNQLKVIFRSLINSRSYTFINIFWLSVSFACCVLIGLYVQNELSYDRYHEKKDRIYRMACNMAGGSFENGIAKIPEPWGPEAKATIPEVENACRFLFYGQALVSQDDKQYYENGGLYVDSTVFDMFSWKLLQGDPRTALSAPNSLVLTETLAEKYFPGQNPVGQSLSFDNETQMNITGVVADPPSNSHFTFRFMVSLAGYTPPDHGNKWERWLQYYTYLLLRPGTKPGQVEPKLDAMIAPNVEPETAEAWTPFLQPITRIHLHSNLHREMAVNSDISYIYIFGAIGLFILLIACTNFINLFTARATHRAKEIGIRKVVGADRFSLILQFIGEAMVVCVISAVLAVGLARLILPSLNTFLSLQLEINLLKNGWLTAGLILMTILTGLLSGSYPAIVLSSFKPMNVLKSEQGAPALSRVLGSIGRQELLRKGLVVFQFAIATFLIVAALVVTNQLDYIQSKNLGFNKDQIINVPMSTAETRQKAETIKQELGNIPGVRKVSISANQPGGSDFGVPYEAIGLPEDQQPPMRCLIIDEDFLDTYEMEIVAGRGFSKDMPTDSAAYLINEAAARQLGWEDPLGQRMSMPNVDRGPAPIIGIVKDFHFRSMHEPIAPLYFFMEDTWYGQFNLKLDAANIDQTLATLEKRWATIEPDHPFRYSFFDQTFGALHAAERRTAQIIRWFTVLAIIITCLGLFGLSTYTAERRTKEIGIRKVLGASVLDIMTLLSREVLLLVILAMLIAFPLAWYATSSWLNNFAYNIDLGATLFLLAAILATGIALLTVSFQSFKSARKNPVKSLRNV